MRWIPVNQAQQEMIHSSSDDWERLATNLRVEQALLSVLDLLSDLPVVVFKGGVLTRQIYGDLRRRASADNDLWLEEPYCSEALERLLNRGYLPVAGLDARAAFRRAGQVALWPAGDHDAVSVDLHAFPFSRMLFRVRSVDLKEHLTLVPFHDRTVTTFDKPLALVHMIAHFLQHRLERSHLTEIATAWDSWDLNEGRLRDLAKKTCGEAALEYTLWLCGELGISKRPSLPLRTARAHVFRRIHSARHPEPRPTRGRLLSILLADPRRLPSATLEAVFLEADDLRSRYGTGRRAAQLARRARELIARG